MDEHWLRLVPLRLFCATQNLTPRLGAGVKGACSGTGLGGSRGIVPVALHKWFGFSSGHPLRRGRQR